VKTRHKIALARMAQTVVIILRRMAGYGSEAQVTRRAVRWQLDLREGIDFSIYLLGAFEPSTVRAYERLIQPDNVVLDIGANIGAHTLPLARTVGAHGKVIACEPTRFAFAKLTANLALNPQLAARVEARQVMLLDGDKDVPPSLYSSWPLAETVGAHDIHLGQMKTTDGARGVTLDKLVDELSLARVDFIKLDVDGFECHVLRGAVQTLKRFRPVIITEIAPLILREQGESLESLVTLLASHGYGLWPLSSETPIPMDAKAIQDMVPDGASLNVLARPVR